MSAATSISKYNWVIPYKIWNSSLCFFNSCLLVHDCLIKNTIYIIKQCLSSSDGWKIWEINSQVITKTSENHTFRDIREAIYHSPDELNRYEILRFGLSMKTDDGINTDISKVDTFLFLLSRWEIYAYFSSCKWTCKFHDRIVRI